MGVRARLTHVDFDIAFIMSSWHDIGIHSVHISPLSNPFDYYHFQRKTLFTIPKSLVRAVQHPTYPMLQ